MDHKENPLVSVSSDSPTGLNPNPDRKENAEGLRVTSERRESEASLAISSKRRIL
jgi:hypothetical protein